MKCLFHCLKIHGWTEELKQSFPLVPTLTIRMEDLFSRHGSAVLDDLITLAGLPHRQELYSMLSERVDAYHCRTEQGFQLQNIQNHPEVLALTRHYDYHLEELEEATLSQRYRARLAERLKRRWWKPTKRRWKRIKRMIVPEKTD